EESEDTVKHSKWGTVRRFDKQKGSGHITPRDGGDDIFVLFRNIVGTGFKTLFQNEQVLYDIEQDRNGKPWAVNVRPAPVPITNGKVLTFDEDLERGTIQPNEGGEPVHFNAEGVLDKDLSEYEEGDLVKYRLVQADSGPVPVRITRLVDPRLPLERFADLSDFDRLLARLANPSTGAAQEE
ncbi:MAG: cold shock domain-containing protein, partial [Verrucomicrobia bacterium]|nr:cold shock domain-containing protein [Verrucomicrobiota bacterium]